MTVIGRRTSLCMAILIPVALGACSSGSAGLSTGTLLGGSTDKPAAPVAAPDTPLDRAFHVGTTSARAQRCGYVFDPAAVRSGYLASETQQGTAPDQIAKAEKRFDDTVATVKRVIAAEDDYCSEDRTASIKRDLNAILSGNYGSPAKQASPAPSSWWGAPSSNDKFDRNKILHPGRPF